MSDPSQTDSAENASGNTPRKFLSILFECCNVYSRIYMKADGSSYQGRCPKCLATVSAKVGEGGSSSRFFRAN